MKKVKNIFELNLKKVRTAALITTLLISLSSKALADVSFPQASQLDPNVTTNLNGNTFQIQHGNGQIFNNSWNSFDVPNGSTVNFNFSQNGQVSVNRVIGNQASQIFGNLTESGAAGKVFLINPNGILFGRDSSVNLGAFTVSTANMTYMDPVNNIYKFEQGNIPASIINEGRIIISNEGFVALMAPVIKNTGTIEAPSGTIALVSGNKYTLTTANGQDISINVDEKLSQNLVNSNEINLISNSGTLKADGGSIIISSKAMDDIVQNAVNNTGIISANTITETNGDIVLGNININADQKIITEGSIQANGIHGGNINIKSGKEALIKGSVSAEGTTSNGGNIHITAPLMKIVSADINASGASGGEILLGGEKHGQNSGILENSQYYFMSRDTNVKADSTSANGNGGEIINWAEKNAFILGNFSAKGGFSSGNGGFLEASAKQNLIFDGTANLSAKNGLTGTLLLDPENIIITNGSLGASDSELDDGIIQASDGENRTFTISQDKLEHLSEETNLVLEATNNITINPLDNGLLFLRISPNGSFTAIADSDKDGVGAFTMSIEDRILTEGAPINIEGAGLTIGRLDTTGHSGSISSNVSLISRGDIVAERIITNNGNIFINSTGNINLKRVDSTGLINVDAGDPGFGKEEAKSVKIAGDTLNFDNLYSSGTIDISADNFGTPNGNLIGGDFNINSYTVNNPITSEELDGIASQATFGGQITIGKVGYNGAVGSGATAADFDGQNLTIKTNGDVNLTGFTNANVINIGSWTAEFDPETSAHSITLSSDNINLDQIYSRGNINISATSNLTIINNGHIKTSGAGDSLILKSDIFTNNSGSKALSAEMGRWLVYATSPETSFVNGLEHQKIYNWTNLDAKPDNYFFNNSITNYFLWGITPVLTVKADDQTRYYGDPNAAFTYTITGFLDGDTLSSIITGEGRFGTAANANSTVGNYALKIQLHTLAANLGYQLVAANGTISVTQRPITITGVDATRVYGDNNPIFNSTVTGGNLVGSDTLANIGVTTASNATAASNVGNYNITPSGILTNYLPTYVSGTLTINPRALAIIADNNAINTGDPIPAFTSQFFGLTNGNTANSIGTLTYTTPAGANSTAGNYSIAPLINTHGNNFGNYTITYTNGILTVTGIPASQTITNQELATINQNMALIEGRSDTYGFGSFGTSASGNAIGNTSNVDNNYSSDKPKTKLNFATLAVENEKKSGLINISDLQAPNMLEEISNELNKNYTNKDASLFDIIKSMIHPPNINL